jgi:hypothetical protein
MEPIYLKNELCLAYQLNWSLSVFTSRQIPESPQWLEQLGTATEADGVRILEYRNTTETTHQFLLSTQPFVVPWAIARSVKGRLQLGGTLSITTSYLKIESDCRTFAKTS